MAWVLSNEILETLPQWQSMNQRHELARHLLLLPAPPTDEMRCYQWLNEQHRYMHSVGIYSLDAMKKIIEALYLTQNTLADDEVLTALKREGQPRIRAAFFYQYLMDKPIRENNDDV